MDLLCKIKSKLKASNLHNVWEKVDIRTNPVCSGACGLIIHVGAARFPLRFLGSILLEDTSQASLPDTPLYA